MAKMVDRVNALYAKPANVRNIAIAAHIDHGKCVKGDTRLLMTDGSWLTAKELFNKISKEGTLSRVTESEIVYSPKKPIKIFSLNKKNGTIEKKTIEHAWNLVGGHLIKIKLRNGFEVSTTPEHRYITLTDMEFKEKEAHELKLGDRIVCSRIISTKKDSEDIKAIMLKKLAKGNFYVNLENEFSNEIKKKVLEEGLEKVETKLKLKSFYHGMWRNRYKLIDLLGICQRFGYNLIELYENISYIYWMRAGGVGKTSMKIKLSENTEDFFYLAGLLVGDGSGNKFVVGKPRLGEEFLRICRNLGFEPVRREYEGKTPELCTNTTILQMFKILFEYPVKKKSHNVKVSNFLASSPKSCIAQFLRAYFDCDGTVEKSRRAISLTSVSHQMLKDLQMLLLQFGILSNRQRDTIYISGMSAKNFEKEIGFHVLEKIKRTRSLVDTTQGSYVLDTIPISNKKMTSLRKVPMAQIDKTYYRYEKRILTPSIEKYSQIMQKFEKTHQGQLELIQLKNLAKGDLAYIEVTGIEQDFAELVYDFTVSDNHNFVAEGMIIHNTTFSDNLLSGAGMMSEETAGKARQLDFREDEQARGITIDTAAVSMVHNNGKDDFLINLLDTPGHVDFGGDVTRAMRAVDGCIILVDAVEGVMPQTETVVRQALKERVKPILFINKVDRLIKELKLTPEQMQKRFVKTIGSVNKLLRSIAEEQFKDKWQVNVQDGSVCFGSAFHNWALSAGYMQEKGITFKDIIEAYEKDDKESLREKCALHVVVLNAVIQHLPSPVDGQKYRIPKIWHGETDSPIGKALMNCDPNGPLMFVVTKVTIDPQAGEICAGRVFSGTLKKGMEVYLNNAKQAVRAQQVYIYNGAKREIVEDVKAGNIIGVGGLRHAFPGETVSFEETTPFEAITHIFDPVITKAIEAKKPSDLPKLVEVLQQVSKEDPSIKIEINHETGEHLMHGMGELHLEIIEDRIKREKGVDIQTSPPIVVYRETCTRLTPAPAEGKSPNKHNKVYFRVEPLNAETMELIRSGKISEGRLKKKDLELWQAFEACGWDNKESRKIKDIFGGNVLVDNTRGIVYIGEVIEMIMDMFEDVAKAGPIAREPLFGVKVILDDLKLHEDAIHRGPAQMYPAVRDSIRDALRQSGPMLLEPIQTVQFESPEEFMGEISKLVSNKRGQLLDMVQEGSQITVKSKLPVGEMFGISSDLRSATGGRGNFFISDQTFERLPSELQKKIIDQIRSRKGLSENQ